LERDQQSNEEGKEDASSFAARMAGASLPDPAVRKNEKKQYREH
jgi:hypothetical protein